jgi:hypothetical protein
MTDQFWPGVPGWKFYKPPASDEQDGDQSGMHDDQDTDQENVKRSLTPEGEEVMSPTKVFKKPAAGTMATAPKAKSKAKAKAKVKAPTVTAMKKPAAAKCVLKKPAAHSPISEDQDANCVLKKPAAHSPISEDQDDQQEDAESEMCLEAETLGSLGGGSAEASPQKKPARQAPRPGYRGCSKCRYRGSNCCKIDDNE